MKCEQVFNTSLTLQLPSVASLTAFSFSHCLTVRSLSVSVCTQCVMPFSQCLCSVLSKWAVAFQCIPFIFWTWKEHGQEMSTMAVSRKSVMKTLWYSFHYLSALYTKRLLRSVSNVFTVKDASRQNLAICYVRKLSVFWFLPVLHL